MIYYPIEKIGTAPFFIKDIGDGVEE